MSVIERAEDLETLRSLWDELYQEQAPSHTIFQSFAWNEIAARIFAKRERPYVVVVESDAGAAIIPACLRDDSISLLGEELFDYRDVLSVGDESVLQRAWDKVAEISRPFKVKAVRGDRTLQWPESKMSFFAGAPFLPAAQKIGRNKKLERNLRLVCELGCREKKYSLADKRSLDYGADAPPLGMTTSGDDEFEGKVRRMYELKGAHESGSLFREPLRIEAVSEMARTAQSELFTFETGGELVASILTFIDQGVCRFYGTYYDCRWALHSPGVTLLYRVIQQAQARGLDFDLMTGEQPYKLRFAREVVPLYRVRAFDRAIGSFEDREILAKTG